MHLVTIVAREDGYGIICIQPFFTLRCTRKLIQTPTVLKQIRVGIIVTEGYLSFTYVIINTKPDLKETGIAMWSSPDRIFGERKQGVVRREREKGVDPGE